MTEKANHLEQELQRRGKAELDLATDRSANCLESLVFFGTPRFTPSGKEPYELGWGINSGKNLETIVCPLRTNYESSHNLCYFTHNPAASEPITLP